MVGRKIAELCLQNQIQQVCFDRGGNVYHGRVQVQHYHMLLEECYCAVPLSEIMIALFELLWAGMRQLGANPWHLASTVPSDKHDSNMLLHVS